MLFTVWQLEGWAGGDGLVFAVAEYLRASRSEGGECAGADACRDLPERTDVGCRALSITISRRRTDQWPVLPCTALSKHVAGTVFTGRSSGPLFPENS